MLRFPWGPIYWYPKLSHRMRKKNHGRDECNTQEYTREDNVGRVKQIFLSITDILFTIILVQKNKSLQSIIEDQF